MIKLKEYQKQTVSEFERYVKRVREYKESDPYIAVFDAICRENNSNNYYNEQNLNAPFVCIKIPTGGGKTIVACHLLNSLYQEYLRSTNDTGIVMWLVPTDVIRKQTILALKCAHHPYRQTLDDFFSGNVKVYDFTEAKSIKKIDVQSNLCVIVATFSTFRIQNKDLRKAYEQNGSLMEHFQDRSMENMLRDDNGSVVESLVNVIRMNQPVVVIDEGHNAKSKLSYDMLKDFNPIFVFEYTATPRKESNVLVNVTGMQLQQENMVKIPIYLKNIAQWQATLRDGITKRDHLEKIAKKEKGEYIRPIALIQAEQEKPDRKKIYVEQIKKHLMSEHDIPPEHIAVETGTNKELQNVDLFSKRCDIRYIITVKALTEGWDNSFAYVLISVANIGAPVAVEQTLGRILRLPNQRKKHIDDLNYSYVYTSSNRFELSAKQIEKGLVQNGYSKQDFKLLEKKTHMESVYGRAISDYSIKLPCIAIKQETKTRRLDFHDDLLGSDFMLSDQDLPDSYVFQSNENKEIIYDLEKDDRFKHSVQTSLDTEYHEKDFDENVLLNWLDKKIRRIEYSQTDKREYLKKIIDHVLNEKKIHLSDISRRVLILREIINSQIDKLELEKAKQKFCTLEKSNQLLLDKIYYTPENTAKINDVSREPFKLHLFKKAGHMNNEELDLAIKIDALDNVKWWYRSIEKKDFFIQGWQKSRFYPDFIIKTNSGNYIIAEYKGENLLTNEDSSYKRALGLKWAELAGEKYHFFMVDKNTVEPVLSKIVKL